MPHALLTAALLGAAATAAPAPQIFFSSAPEAAAQEQRGMDAVDETKVLQRAARLLMARGYEEDGKRLQEIVREMRSARGADVPAVSRPLEMRATALMKRDINERETRIAVIQLVSDSFAAEGWGTKSAAMQWFANIGTPEGASAPMPEVLQSENSTTMERIVEVIEEGGRLQARSGRQRAARAHMWLAKFYRERDGIARAEPTPPGPAGPSGPSTGRRSGADPSSPGPSGPSAPSPRSVKRKDLTYIEGRAPVLAIAKKAFEVDTDLPPDLRAKGLEWMSWMAAHADLRVQRNRGEGMDGDAPPAPGPASMEELIGLIKLAGKVHADAGRAREAKRCFDLASYYEKREAGEAPDNSRTNRIAAEPAGPSGPSIGTGVAGPSGPSATDVNRRRLESRRAELEAQIAEVQARIDEARAELERLRASGGRR